MIGAVGILYLASLTPISSAIISPLEKAYPKYAGQVVEYVLVLGGGHVVDESIPLSSWLHHVSLKRLYEGIDIYNANPGAKLLLSGYKGNTPESHAKIASRVAVSLGVNKSDIILAESVKDTRQEAEHWTRLIGGKPFALVTSASHMPRAVELFSFYQGENGQYTFVPAPTDFRASSSTLLSLRNWVPKASSLRMLEVAWHEYIGSVWNKLTL